VTSWRARVPLRHHRDQPVNDLLFSAQVLHAVVLEFRTGAEGFGRLEPSNTVFWHGLWQVEKVAIIAGKPVQGCSQTLFGQNLFQPIASLDHLCIGVGIYEGDPSRTSGSAHLHYAHHHLLVEPAEEGRKRHDGGEVRHSLSQANADDKKGDEETDVDDCETSIRIVRHCPEVLLNELACEDKGQEEQDAFMTKIRGGKPLKDVGAAISHGEYAHRIQWYVLRMAAKEVGSTTWLRSLYKVLGASEYIKVVDSIKAPVLNYTWTLWGALVDIPASLEKEETIGNVGYSAPVNLTKDLSEGAGEMKYSMIQLAVLNRRLKRYYSAKAKKTQKRGDKVLEKMLENIETTMVSAHFTDEEIDEAKKGLQKAEKKAQKGEVVDYDERNRLAFALCGIPLQGKSL